MTQPALGEVISAKYKGTCTRTGRSYGPGTKIARDGFGYHLADAPDPGGDIGISFGSGETSRFYGVENSPHEIGETVWHGDQAVVITRAGHTFYREDGLSFGVGADRGYVYRHLARPATPEEAAPLLAQRAAQQAARERRARFDAGARTLFADATDTPEGTHAPRGREVMLSGADSRIYGGGTWLVVDADGEHVWYVRNNGADGDFWGANNIRTGGAGGIGHRLPLTPERRAWLAEHAPEPQVQQGEDDDRL